MGKSSAPPVDYAAQASAQASANKDSAQFNDNSNRVDQITPLGSSTWQIKPGADPKNPQPGDYIQTTSLSPGQQSLLDSQNTLSQTLAQGATAGVNKATTALSTPFSTASLNPLQGAPQAGAVQSSVDRSGLPSLTQDYGAQRDQVVNALMSRVQPDLDTQHEQLDTKLANQGIDLGSTAYQRAQDLQGRTDNDARQQAILAGGTEQSRLASLASSTRAQLSGEATTDASLHNTAQAQQYQQGLAGAQFGNQARQQGLTEEEYLRTQPLNEVNALRTGSQVQMPTFSNFYTGNAAPAPIMDAGIAQGNANTALNAQNNASSNASTAAIASILAAFVSDARLKEDIVTIGWHPAGVRRVSWKWKNGMGRSSGVLAQELQAVRPDAVVDMGSGILGVRYDLIGGQ